jgi:hypothetical protein
MDRVYLQWNLPNWITVVLMAGIGVLILQAATSGIRQYQAK